MGWKKRSIYAWHALLGLTIFTSLTLALLDTEAASQNIDSVYIGKLSAAWIDAEHTEGCGERLLGVLDNTNLTFGPVHDNTTDHSNPYFISLVSPQTENLTVTMQSSISSETLGTTWWSVAAELDNDDEEYKITGTLKSSKNLTKNKFSGNFGRGGSWCGIKKDGFEWEYQVSNTTFSGTITEDGDAEFQIEGSMVDEDTGRTIAYTIQFHGKWDSGTAKLNFSSKNPTWPEAGTGEQDSVTGARTSAILIDTGPTPTGSTKKDDDRDFMDDVSKKLGLGGIVGVISGGILLLGIVGALIFCAVNRRKRHREAGKVYPEVAYIYTPSPDLDGGYPGSYRSNSELDMREVLVNDHSLPVTNQHQWRQF